MSDQEEKVTEIYFPCRLCDANFVVTNEEGLTWEEINKKFINEGWTQSEYLDYRCPDHRRG